MTQAALGTLPTVASVAQIQLLRAGVTQLGAACLLLIAKVFEKVIRQVGLTVSSCVAM